MNDGEGMEVVLKRKIFQLASELPVNKDLKSNAMCFRDPDTSAVVCVKKTYVSDRAFKISGYATLKGQRIVTVGDPKEIKELESTIGP